MCYYTAPSHLSWSPRGTRIAVGCWFHTDMVPVQGGGAYCCQDASVETFGDRIAYSGAMLGRRIAYFGGPEGIRTLMVASADGSNPYEVLERSAVPGPMFGAQWFPDGQWLTFQAENTYWRERRFAANAGLRGALRRVRRPREQPRPPHDHAPNAAVGTADRVSHGPQRRLTADH